MGGWKGGMMGGWKGGRDERGGERVREIKRLLKTRRFDVNERTKERIVLERMGDCRRLNLNEKIKGETVR